MNLKYNPITKSLLVMIPLISASPVVSQDAALLVEKFATVNGTRVHYRIGGEGPFLLLLHGFTLSGEQWEPFIHDFAKHYTVIVPDLPGHGKSGSCKADYEQWAALMLGLLKELKIDQVRGIGHSAGAITLLHMAEQDPGSLKSMILVSGAHRFGLEGCKLLMEDRFEKADKAFQDYYLSIHPGGLPQIESIFKDLNNMARSYSISADKAVLSPEILANINTPAFLIWGDRDPYFPLESATELYQLLPNAQLWVIPGQGHVPLWVNWGGDADAAERFVTVVAQFFSRYQKLKQSPY